MSLIKSISGIRGTIGGIPDFNLTPIDLVKFTAAYAEWLKKYSNKTRCKVVVGRDARLSGQIVKDIVIGTLMGCGCDVINIGLATTPTTEIAVTGEQADGGIILTASHNPKQWNALKLLNEKGEFLNKTEGEAMLALASKANFEFADVDNLGMVTKKNYTKKHIDMVIGLDLVDVKAIKKADFHVVIDCINSVGGIVIPALLEALGVRHVQCLNCEPNGIFAHTPEPIPENLTGIADYMKRNKADVGFVVDPDVDRLAIICENGNMFNEEYTLVSVADYVLQHTPGNTVSNLSSSRALSDITQAHGGKYFAAAVGEVNVVNKMKEIGAVIGGEGNGGVIYPAAHYGRDALVGIALFLTQLAKTEKTVTELKANYPLYSISKNKIQLTPEIDVDKILITVKNLYAHKYPVNDLDGVKIDFPDGWVHLRKSNTEPIIRIYSEAETIEKANAFAQQIINEVKGLI